MYVLVKTEHIVQLNWLTTNLSQNCVVKETFKRNSLENCLPNHNAQYFSSNLKEVRNVFVKIELIKSSRCLAEGEHSKFSTEGFVDAETDPLS